MGGASNGQVIKRMQAERDADHATQESALALAIGQSVAAHLGGMIEQATRVNCFFCVGRAASMVNTYRTAVANAQAAAEPVPEPPNAPPVGRAVTRVPCVQMVPVPGLAAPVPVCCNVPSCFECVLQQQAGHAAAKGPVTVGLVDLAGNPLSFRRG